VNFGPRHYVPVLKLKRAEKAALGLLAETITTHVTPLLEIVEMPKGTPSGKSKALDRHLTNAFRRLKESVLPFKRYFLDAREIAAVGAVGAERAFEEAVQLGVPFTPVTGISRTTDIAASLLRVAKNGIAIRLTRSEFENRLVRRLLPEFLTTNRLEPSAVDLIIDIGAVDQMIPAGVASMMRTFVADVPHPAEWRTLSVVGCAFPKSMGVVKTDSHKIVDRSEWLAWRDDLHTHRADLTRLPTFGDCGIQRPEGVEGLDFRFIPIAGALRYANDDGWLLVKGHSRERTPLAKQLPLLARKLVDGGLRAYFAGEDHCEGCGGAVECAAGAKGFVTLEAWRRLGTAHHITNTVLQIQSLSWP
jgi:hypothetical protein